ncbi:Surface carbohydrate biosynthesis protein, LIC13510 family [Burkholderiaceae bacterium]
MARVTNKLFTVWDSFDQVPGGENYIYWQSFLDGEQGISIPAYVEKNANTLRKKYLAFIYDLGQVSILGKRIVEHLELEGANYWWMSSIAEKSPFKTPEIYTCIRLIALEEILLRELPDAITLISDDRKLANAIFTISKKLKIKFRYKKNRQVFSGKVSINTPILIRGAITFVSHVISRWQLTNIKSPEWFAGEKSIFLCSHLMHLSKKDCDAGVYKSEQWGDLPRRIQKQGWRMNWIHHFLISKAVPTEGKGLKLLESFNSDSYNQGTHSFIEAYLSWGILFKTIKSLIRLFVIQWMLFGVKKFFSPKDSSISFWPILRESWLSSLSGPTAVYNCLWAHLFDRALKDMPHQRVGLYLQEMQGWEVAFLRSWRKYGHGKIIGVPHATIPFWHLYYHHDYRTFEIDKPFSLPLPDRVAINGEAAYSALKSSDFPLQICSEVEAIRYLKLGNLLKMPNSKINHNLKHSPSQRRGILVVGDMLPDSMHFMLRMLEGASNTFKEKLEVTIKLHPGLTVDFERYPGISFAVITEPLHQILQNFSMVISANSTSAAVDAYVAGLRVIVIQQGSGLNLSPLRGCPGVEYAKTIKDLVDLIISDNISIEDFTTRNNYFNIGQSMSLWLGLIEDL